jgi:cytochrome c-type biogenesis protein CcmE
MLLIRGIIMNKNKRIILVFSIIPILVLGYLAYKGLEGTAAYYYTIEEAVNLEAGSRKIRIKGSLVANSVDYQPEIPLLSFTISHGENQLSVRHKGVLPNNLTHADEIIVEGRFNDVGEFEASKLMLQCPSKYEDGSGGR